MRKRCRSTAASTAAALAPSRAPPGRRGGPHLTCQEPAAVPGLVCLREASYRVLPLRPRLDRAEDKRVLGVARRKRIWYFKSEGRRAGAFSVEAGVTMELGNPGSISCHSPPGATSTPPAQTPRGAADARSHSERGAGAVLAPLPSQQHRVCSSQPACARDTELPVETDGTALEAIQEALQGIRCHFLTRGCAAKTLRQQQRVPSVTHASCHHRDKWPGIIVVIVIIVIAVIVTAAVEHSAPPSQRTARRCGSKAGRESTVQTQQSGEQRCHRMHGGWEEGAHPN